MSIKYLLKNSVNFLNELLNKTQLSEIKEVTASLLAQPNSKTYVGNRSQSRLHFKSHIITICAYEKI